MVCLLVCFSFSLVLFLGFIFLVSFHLLSQSQKTLACCSSSFSLPIFCISTPRLHLLLSSLFVILSLTPTASLSIRLFHLPFLSSSLVLLPLGETKRQPTTDSRPLERLSEAETSVDLLTTASCWSVTERVQSDIRPSRFRKSPKVRHANRNEITGSSWNNCPNRTKKRKRQIERGEQLIVRVSNV